MNKPVIIPYFNKYPQISKKSFIAPNSSIIGEVYIGEGSGVWFNCVIRGDIAPITIGERSNIQDSTVIHTARNGGRVLIGSNVTVGHSALLHACTLEDNSFVGMGAIVMDGAVVETGGWVAAGSLITNNKIVRSGEIWAGSPAKFFRKLSLEEKSYILESANNYYIHAIEYNAQFS